MFPIQTKVDEDRSDINQSDFIPTKLLCIKTLIKETEISSQSILFTSYMIFITHIIHLFIGFYDNFPTIATLCGQLLQPFNRPTIHTCRNGCIALESRHRARAMPN